MTPASSQFQQFYKPPKTTDQVILGIFTTLDNQRAGVQPAEQIVPENANIVKMLLQVICPILRPTTRENTYLPKERRSDTTLGEGECTSAYSSSDPDAVSTFSHVHCEPTSHYLDCEYDRDEQEKTDGGLGAGTPMFLSEVMHGSACNIL
ncbi:hypothetical protein J6590_098975 [Homalodisca vitripennis]|nr:hypothetical protein J6590_098975 [Homalodisca vitripennis]